MIAGSSRSTSRAREMLLWAWSTICSKSCTSSRQRERSKKKLRQKSWLTWRKSVMNSQRKACLRAKFVPFTKRRSRSKRLVRKISSLKMWRLRKEWTTTIFAKPKSLTSRLLLLGHWWKRCISMKTVTSNKMTSADYTIRKVAKSISANFCFMILTARLS